MPGFESLPPDVLKNIVGNMGVQTFGRFCQVNKAVNQANAATLGQLRQMLTPDDVPKAMSGTLLANTLAEKHCLRVLIDCGLVRIGDVRVWELVPPVVKLAVAKQFERPTLKPDAVAGLRPLDFFTSNLPRTDRGATPQSIERAVETALTSGIPNEVRSKWQHYGVNTIAVVNVSQFPDTVSTPELVRRLSLTVTRPTGNQSLWLVRGKQVVRVYN
jgi:hypothetical protein